MSAPDAVTTLVGDVVGSREYPDQPGLLRTLADVLAQVNDAVTALQPLEVTVGDEFQGAYARLADALLASLLVRVLASDATPPGADEAGVDVRVGIGFGRLDRSEVAPPPLGQSGPAWWTAREALDDVTEAVHRAGWPRGLRTAFRSEDRVRDAALNAFLLCRDDLVAAMDARDRRILLGLFRGERQVDIADELGVSQPAVARRQRDNGASAVHRAHLHLEEAT